MEALLGWVRDELPGLNAAVEMDVLEPEALVEDFRSLIARLAPDYLSRWQARQHLQLIGFGLSSIEKHFRECGHPPGYALAQFDGLETLLLKLGDLAAHPPRDSHYTYWLWNDGSLSFTGDPQETFFYDMVCLTHVLHSESLDAIRPLCTGNVPLDHASVVERLQETAANLAQLHTGYRAFMQRGPDGQRNMEPVFFMRRMRTYLPTFPIGGMEWGGVNAANLAVQMQIDYLIGAVNDDYAHVVEGRWRYLTVEDQAALALDMQLPSLLDVLLCAMHMTPDTLLSRPVQDVARCIAELTAPEQDALAAYRDIVVNAGKLTAMHWALIQNYLVKPSQQLSPEEKAKMAVSPDEGTGKASHAETEAIMRMRREHPHAWKLVDAVEVFQHG